MSKKNRRRSPEIPQVGNALEIPNYVIPMTDLEYRETMDPVDPRGETRGEDCRPAPRGEGCGEDRRPAPRGEDCRR